MSSFVDQEINPVLLATCDGVQASIKEDGQELLTPGAGVASSVAASGLTVSGWDEVNQVSKVLRTDANGDLIVTGTIIVVPGVATDGQQTLALFDSTHPVSHNVVPAGDYSLEYFTANLIGLTVGSAVTATITYQFGGGANYATVVITKTVSVPASGIVDLYSCFDDFRKGGDAVQLDITTTSVAATGKAYTTIATAT